MRTWRGAVRPGDLDRYLGHQDRTGIREYRDTPGNRGVLVLTRDTGDAVEVVTVSFWDDMDAVRRFAGDDPDRARFYPGDDDLLVQKDLHVTHQTVHSADLDPGLTRLVAAGRS
jgi:heme-degrading monooxygenase HmoA